MGLEEERGFFDQKINFTGFFCVRTLFQVKVIFLLQGGFTWQNPVTPKSYFTNCNTFDAGMDLN